jgi:predicted nucleic acid-binding protein
MAPPTLFNGTLVVTDSMVLINFHGLLALDKFINWAKGEIVVEKRVKDEAQFSVAGPLDLNPYIENKSVIEEEIEGEEQEDLFYHYISNKVDGVTIHEAEAACLALAITKGYGLACDEKVVRDEFKRKCPKQICFHSWGIVDKAKELGFISEQEAKDLKKGLYYV